MTLYSKLIDRDTDELVVCLAPMNLPSNLLPHFASNEEFGTSALLVNPANKNFYLDCLDELLALVENAQRQVRASKLLFCGSSMGGFGALLLGSLCTDTSAVVAYAPCLRVDHPGSVSALNMDPALLSHRYGDVRPLIEQSPAEKFIFIPCLDRQDSIHVADAQALQGRARHHVDILLCDHDVHRFVGLPGTVKSVLQTGRPPEHLLQPYRASPFEVECSKLVYQFYLNETQDQQRDFSVPELPTEASVNWTYFYWKARYLHSKRQLWSSLHNFTAALARGGERVAEVHFCMANALKDMGQHRVALGHYRQAAHLAPSDVVQRAIVQLEQTIAERST